MLDDLASVGLAHDQANFLQVALCLTASLKRRPDQNAKSQRLLDELERVLDNLSEMSRCGMEGAFEHGA